MSFWQTLVQPARLRRLAWPTRCDARVTSRSAEIMLQMSQDLLRRLPRQNMINMINHVAVLVIPSATTSQRIELFSCLRFV
jgi:hypothetical protein